jgi:hypothetical protein
MSSPETERGIDRRSLIKRGAVAGAAAWTAPLILDSALSPAAAQSAGPPDPPAPAVATGIRFVNASNQGGNVTLSYGGTPTATTAASSAAVPSGNGRFFQASVQLIDQYGAPFVNTGATITVTITRTGGNGGPTPASLSILNGASTSSLPSSMTFANGNTQGALNAAATVGGPVTATASSTT